MNDVNEEHSVDWDADLRARFPEWLTDEACQRWPAVRSQLDIGQSITGTVIARAPFGVWLDIGVTFPALLLVPNMEDAQIRRIMFDDYPAKGTVVDCRINALGDDGKISVTQLDFDRIIKDENTT